LLNVKIGIDPTCEDGLSQREPTFDLVRTLVDIDIDSGSYDRAAVVTVGEQFRAFLAAHFQPMRRLYLRQRQAH
jgi:hypothetical protein